MAYNSGQVKFGTPGGATTDSASLSTRRLYDFSDRVADLSPEESPFFVYLSKVGKVSTSDSQFRYLEDRTKIAIADRSFLSTGGATLVAEGSDMDLVFDTTGGAAVSWLIPGMIVAVSLNATESGTLPAFGNVRINTVTQGSASTTCGVTSVSTVAGAAMTIADNAQCTVIGTSFVEGSGAPDVWSETLDNGFGYTQIFKTACEMSNTARATVYRGYADEWARLWNLKLREHKVDIERAMLFGQQASRGGIQYTDGVVGQIIRNSTAEADGGQLSYTSDKSYYKTNTAAQWTYDDLLSDFEVIYDPARGGSASKLGLASLPVISYFNKLGNGAGFVATSSGGTEDNPLRYNFNQSNGSFGHKVMKIETIHGDLSLVKEPLFRGFSAGFLSLVDLDHCSYRPLVGNGVNRDTSITTNVQQADEDLRKDMILTEAGLEVTLPETHALINLEGVN
jgi:hypothetical protein|tara:strand:+ start:662 stop:2017 length:1356 start_codon:yes stop_codon:yes gene_type:complete